jgi:glucan biosynthesis protein C
VEVMRKSAMAKRMYFFDNLKAFIILLIVVFHVAMGYTTWDLKWWYVNDIYKSNIFDLFILSTDVYIMPIMFMIAGYFAAAVLFKKDITVFWQDKCKRIVLPWIAGVVFIAPLIAYSAIYSRTDTPPNYFSFVVNDFLTKYFQQAHFWFLGILTLFFILLTIAYIFNSTYFNKPPQREMPSIWFFPGFVLLAAVPFFLANLFYSADAWVNANYIFLIQPVRIGLYLCYFGLGVYAWEKSWFTRDGYCPSLVTWSISAVIMLFVFLAYRVTYTFAPDIPVLFKAGHALTYSIFCLTTTFALIALFQRAFDSDAYLWRRLAANSYTIYFIHQCVVIPLAYTVKELQWNIWIKYAGVSISSVVLCFLISEYAIQPILSIGKKEKNNKIFIKF